MADERRRPKGQDEAMSRGAGIGFAGAIVALAVGGITLCGAAQAQGVAQCNAPLEAKDLEHAPAHFRERIAQGKPLKIVAIGSSSTSGAGASSSAASYPAQLRACRSRFSTKALAAKRRRRWSRASTPT